MANVKYIRVSTKEQNTARQEKDVANYDKVYTEKVSGKSIDRPELKRMMEYIREGDTVTVDSYSRFARNTRDLLYLVDELNKRGVALVSMKEKIDTSTPAGKFMLTVFSGLAEFEREQMLLRQAEGIEIAKEQGKYKGRKPIAVNKVAFLREYFAVKEEKQTALQAMKTLGLKPNTFYRRKEEYGLK